MTDEPDDGAWFRPKRYGYGAGLPLRWQGWAVLAGYIAVLLGPYRLLLAMNGTLPKVAAFAVIGLATLALVLISKARTRGGWKWRNGSE